MTRRDITGREWAKSIIGEWGYEPYSSLKKQADDRATSFVIKHTQYQVDGPQHRYLVSEYINRIHAEFSSPLP